jgi:dTDP-4-dehydrorhamnose 3,5-epimerase
MRFATTDLDGLVVVELQRIEDERGSFARIFCADAFASAGLATAFPQCNISLNRRRGTLRGLHWQDAPYPEGKLVRCTRGAVWDVAVDLRPDSPTFRRWLGFDLTASNGRALYIPPGFAHGFQTLEDDVEVFYHMTESYRSGLARGALWNDPAFSIAWPLPDPILSPRDASHPAFRP